MKRNFVKINILRTIRSNTKFLYWTFCIWFQANSIYFNSRCYFLFWYAFKIFFISFIQMNQYIQDSFWNCRNSFEVSSCFLDIIEWTDNTFKSLETLPNQLFSTKFKGFWGLLWIKLIFFKEYYIELMFTRFVIYHPCYTCINEINFINFEIYHIYHHNR